MGSAVLLFVPGIDFVVLAPELDYVTNTAAMLIAGAVALLAWIRSRETSDPDAPYQASAFTILFLGGAVVIAILISDQSGEAGFDRAAPGQAPLYLWTVQRLFAALLLLGGAAAALRDSPPSGLRQSSGLVIVPAAVMLTLTALVLIGRHDLPVLVPADDLARLTTTSDVLDARVLNTQLMVIQLAVAALFLAAVVAYVLVYRREGGRRPYVAYLSGALVVAAFSQVHFAIVPGAYSDLLSSGDMLRLSFYALLGLGVVAGWRQDLHDLREANDTLLQMRAVDAERATLEERSRMARDIHDGLVQELWLARLTHGQLVRSLQDIGSTPAGVVEAARRVDGILDEALAEARQAVVTLQPQINDGFGGLLRRFVEDYADRFGLDVDCTVPEEPITLDTRTQGEIIRICREALNNARKHADSSLVHIALECREGRLRLTVTDDGKGFDPEMTRSGFGLVSMAERAAGLGGALRVEAAPTRGTRVTLDVPGENR